MGQYTSVIYKNGPNNINSFDLFREGIICFSQCAFLIYILIYHDNGSIPGRPPLLLCPLPPSSAPPER